MGKVAFLGLCEEPDAHVRCNGVTEATFLDVVYEWVRDRINTRSYFAFRLTSASRHENHVVKKRKKSKNKKSKSKRSS